MIRPFESRSSVTSSRASTTIVFLDPPRRTVSVR
jgi:hypothetical protein